MPGHRRGRCRSVGQPFSEFQPLLRPIARRTAVPLNDNALAGVLAFLSSRRNPLASRAPLNSFVVAVADRQHYGVLVFAKLNLHEAALFFVEALWVGTGVAFLDVIE